MHRIEKGEYPVAALREMLLNALVHKTYMGAAIQIRVYDDLVRKNYIAYDPTNDSYKIQGKSMYFGLKSYIEKISDKER